MPTHRTSAYTQRRNGKSVRVSSYTASHKAGSGRDYRGGHRASAWRSLSKEGSRSTRQLVVGGASVLVSATYLATATMQLAAQVFAMLLTASAVGLFLGARTVVRMNEARLKAQRPTTSKGTASTSSRKKPASSSTRSSRKSSTSSAKKPSSSTSKRPAATSTQRRRPAKKRRSRYSPVGIAQRSAKRRYSRWARRHPLTARANRLAARGARRTASSARARSTAVAHRGLDRLEARQQARQHRAAARPFGRGSVISLTKDEKTGQWREYTPTG